MTNLRSREEHLEWAKQRAFRYVDEGELLEALTSIGSDLQKHPDTRNHRGYDLGLGLWLIGDLHTQREMRHFIEGFQ